MTLVTSLMTVAELPDADVRQAADILSKSLNAVAVSDKYHYDDQQFFEADIDLMDVVFTKETLYNGIKKLISAYEEIMDCIETEIDFITANDDTASEVLRYEKDINDVKEFGLFVTKRTIPNCIPYYTSDRCNAYLNLSYVSFGVYDDS